MTVQQQRTCPNCGPVLAVKNDPPTCSEHVGMSMLAVLTCGFGLIFVIPWVLYRGVQSSHWHCQQCGMLLGQTI